jgi:hypothetical protein
MGKDILLDADGDLAIVNGDFVLGDSELQEVETILSMMQGALKEDPIMGANLIHYEKSTLTPDAIKAKASIALQRDGKDFNQIKKGLELNVSKR